MEYNRGTRNETVDRMAGMRMEGHVVPQAWCRTIRKGTGKPNLNAIMILSDIVSLYTPGEERDRVTGEKTGFIKKFRGDLLQKSYQEFADQFGITRRDATNAMVELEKLGVVKRVLRTVRTGQGAVPNVLFIALDVDVLERLTFPEGRTDGRETEEEAKGTDAGRKITPDRRKRTGNENGGRGGKMPESGETAGNGEMPEKRGIAEDGEISGGREEKHAAGEASVGIRGDGGKRKGSDESSRNRDGALRENTGCMPVIRATGNAADAGGHGVPDFGDISGSRDSCCGNHMMRGGKTEKYGREMGYDNHLHNYPVSPIYQQAVEDFKEQISYGELSREYGGDRRLDELVSVAADIITSTAKTIRVNREERPAAVVRARFEKLTDEHVEYVLESLASVKKRIINVRAVMVTALYNAVDTFGTYMANLYCRDQESGRPAFGMA